MKKLETLKFNIEFISPLINRREKCKDSVLLPQTVRGVMRYYFRATAARVFGNNYKKIKGLEDIIFGSNNNKSLFDVTISLQRENKIKLSKLMNLRYSLYGIILNKKSNDCKNKEEQNNENPNEKINLLDSGSEFSIRFIFYKSFFKRRIKDYNKVDEHFYKFKEFIKDLFVLISLVGGFGAKVKKGFGQFVIRNIERDIKLEDIGTILKSLEEKIKYLDKIFVKENEKNKENSTNNSSISDEAFDFPAFVDGFFHVYKLKKEFYSDKDALRNIYSPEKNNFSYLDLKKKLRDSAFKDAIQNFNDEKKVDFNDALLGLPVLFYYSKANYKLNALDDKGNEYRKSSLLTIKLWKEKNGKYKVYLIVLLSKIHLKNSKLVLKKIVKIKNREGKSKKKEFKSSINIDFDYNKLKNTIEKYKELNKII
ncbi:CRISPR-associated protein Cmr1 [Thermosipho japonicus]|uniref:CRISPR-associated protein Cmr1 n=1 Tax=Thermosipho japonicus TaxID=90323 RepID=A0A841GIJ6_9BACT|nr:type III-B CRISPR module RAMP protein Cmr1 [Thermosipho japonicus]MBB6063462.1 CRISPR-associated protein Cmr1 [Thermosipho japonicus]